MDQIAKVGVPVNVDRGSDSEGELAYMNHISVDRHAIALWEEAMGDITTGGGNCGPGEIGEEANATVEVHCDVSEGGGLLLEELYTSPENSFGAKLQ